MSKQQLKSWQELDNQVTAIFLLAFKKWRLEWRNVWFVWFFFTSSFVGWFCQWYHFSGNLMVRNKILAFFCRLIKLYFITVCTEVCISKPLYWLNYAFSVQCFENTTIVAYAGLRVKWTWKTKNDFKNLQFYINKGIGLAGA